MAKKKVAKIDDSICAFQMLEAIEELLSVGEGELANELLHGVLEAAPPSSWRVPIRSFYWAEQNDRLRKRCILGAQALILADCPDGMRIDEEVGARCAATVLMIAAQADHSTARAEVA